MKSILLLVLFGLSLSFSAHSQGTPAYVNTAYLAAWYSFTGNAIDSSANLSFGITSNVALTNDRSGHANSSYYFNGINSNISTPSKFTDTNTLGNRAISVWIKRDTLQVPNTSAKYVLSSGINVDAENFSLYLDQFNSLIFDGGGTHNIALTAIGVNAIDTNWHHIVINYYHNGSNTVDSMRFYLDGVFSHYSGSCNLSLSYTPIMIGAKTDASGSTAIANTNFAGVIDDIGIWNRTLTDCEIQRLYLARSTFILSCLKDTTIGSPSITTYSITETPPILSTTYQWQENKGTGWFNCGTTTTVCLNPQSKIMTIDTSIAANTLSNTYSYRCIRNGACSDTSTIAQIPPLGLTNIH
ncbi:MAG: LamG domain-containing protein, partial [Bacteroidota bacterium]